jgi:indolepyruvate ferredoxin oxidoreductase, beta subunit
MIDTTNLIFAGVGGQGVLLIAEITALTAVRAGYDVKQTEVHGVSQRGGSVESHVRFGEVVHSPLVTPGQADVVIGLEKLEGLRYANFVRPSPPAPRPTQGEGGILLVNDHEIIPGSVANAVERYPHNSIDFLRDKGVRVIAVPASRLAQDLGDGRMANIVLLGALSTLIDLPEAAWQETLKAKLPAKYRDANLRAFTVGKESIAVQAA